jgi:diadenylate cyclase
LNEFFQSVRDMFVPGKTALVTVIDILLVAYIVYRLLKLIRGTRAWRVVLAVAVFIVALVLSDFLEFKAVHYILEKATLLSPVALVILFLPELRQAIDGFARIGSWSEKFMTAEVSLSANVLEEVVAAVTEMSDQRTGALLIIERGSRLDDIAANGVPVKAQVTAPLLGAIFNEGGPLHDGAVIIRQNLALAAACRLPLSENTKLDPHFHMRHRAAIGISEQSDCVAIVISEERGSVAVAIDGRVHKVPSAKELRDILNQELRGSSTKKRHRRATPDRKVKKVG